MKHKTKKEHAPVQPEVDGLAILADELETEEGLRRLGEEAYQEAMEAQKRGSMYPKKTKH